MANSDLARESFVKENLVLQSEKAMDAEKQAVITTLNQYLPAMRPTELDAKKQAILTNLRMHLAVAFILGVLGLLAVLFRQ